MTFSMSSLGLSMKVLLIFALILLVTNLFTLFCALRVAAPYGMAKPQERLSDAYYQQFWEQQAEGDEVSWVSDS